MAIDADTTVVAENVPEMECAHCGCRVDVSAFDPFVQVRCPECEGLLTVPARLGSFVLLERIASGGMGSVYRARDESLGRMVAIKVMRPELGEDAEFVADFQREAQAAARLNHPGIAQIYSFGQEMGQPYIVMELVSGRHFDAMVHKGEPLAPGFVLRIGLDIAEGLLAADEINLVHGDIKPENILLDEKGKAKLVDFGIANFERAVVDENAVWGTPYYIAPEKVRGRKADNRSDIYSLGATLYHALAGRPPFDGQTPGDVVKARLEAPAPALGKVCPGIDSNVESIIARMLQAEPARRYPTYASLIGDLRRALAAIVPGTTGSAVDAKRRTGPIVGAAALSSTGKYKIRAKNDPEVSAALSEYRRHVTDAPKRSKGSRAVLVIVLVVLVLAGAGATYLLIKSGKDRALEAQAEVDALAAARDEAVTLVALAQAGHSNIYARALAARARLAVATNMVMTITGEPFVLRPAAGAIGAMNGVVEPRVVQLAREAVSATKGVYEFDDPARQITLRARLTRNGALEASTSFAAGQAVDKLRDLLREIDELDSGQAAAFEKVDQAARDAELLRETMQGEAEQARLAAERAAEASAEQEAERKRREEQAAKLRDELASVRALRTDNQEMIKQYRYAEYLELLKRARPALETEDARSVLDLQIERFGHVAGLKENVIEYLGANPFPWGWKSGRSLVDVLSADADGVRIKGGTVPWTEVSVSQMLRFVGHYLKSPELKVREIADGNMAAAILCQEHGGLQMAESYAAKAIETAPHIREEVERLVAP